MRFVNNEPRQLIPTIQAVDNTPGGATSLQGFRRDVDELRKRFRTLEHFDCFPTVCRAKVSREGYSWNPKLDKVRRLIVDER